MGSFEEFGFYLNKILSKHNYFDNDSDMSMIVIIVIIWKMDLKNIAHSNLSEEKSVLWVTFEQESHQNVNISMIIRKN